MTLRCISQADAEGTVTVRYHLPDGNYGNPASSNFEDFWGCTCGRRWAT